MFLSATAFNQPIGNWIIGTGSQIPVGGIDMASMFNNADAFNQNIGSWNVEKVVSMYGMFSYNGIFNNGGSPDINNWRPISCSNFQLMFYENPAFNQPIGGWQLGTGSHLTTGIGMYGMFWGANSFNQNIGSWNVEKVTTMPYLFRQNSGFNNGGSPDINNWRPVSCSSFLGMFDRATAFNQPIGNWQLGTGSHLTTGIDMSSMFYVATSFNQDIGAWDVSRVINMPYMFSYANKFNNSGSDSIKDWRPISCSNFSYMFNGATAFNQPIGNWTIGTGSNMNVTMSSMFYDADAFNQNIGAWNVEKVTNMSSMFDSNSGFNNSGSADINNWRPISCSNFFYMFYNSPFNQPVGNWPLSASNIDVGAMFRNTPFNQDLSNWDVSRVTSFSTIFQQSSFNNSGSAGINNWQINTGSNVSFFQMFYQCPFNQPIGSWNVEKVTTMYSMFENNYSFNQDLNSWTPISCSTFSRMFYRSRDFNQPVGGWTLPTDRTFTMDLMFGSAGTTNPAMSFNQNIGAWNVEKATTMASMFINNTAFNNSGSADINAWTPVSCSSFASMFQSTTAFNQPVEGWTLPTDRTYTMQNMFSGATSFNQPLGMWNIVSCSNMTGMLDNCGMDIPNYSNTLTGWVSQAPNIPSGITLGATGREYDTPGSASRATLIADYGWTFTGDTYVP